MPFKWLPDADLDPHPRLTWLVECCFDLTVLALFRKEEIVPADFRLDPGTLVVSNHQRDADVPILTTVLCRREGFYIRRPLPFYATREDIFRPGFLADFLAHWPRPLPALLGRIPLRWLFRIVRAEPMRRVREFTLVETLAALRAGGFADAAPATVLNRRGRRAAGDALPERLARMSVRRLGAAAHAYWGLRRIRRDPLRKLGPDFRATVSAQLARFAALLDAGRIVYFAPEGTISETGAFGRMRAGPWRVYRLAGSPPPIQPLALSYDPLGPGRLRVVARIGERLRGLDAADRRRFDTALRREILKLYALTPSHFLSRFLARGPAEFTTADFSLWLRTAGDAVRAAGLTLDPLLARSSPEALAATRLDWCARRGLIVPTAGAWAKRRPADAAPGWSDVRGIVRYLDTAIDNLAEVSPDLSRRLQP